MPCSAFLIRTTATMSLKPHLRHRRHFALVRPSLLLSCFMNTNNALYHTHSVTGLLRWNSAQAADVVCMSSSRAAERSTDWKPARRRTDAAVLSWNHQRQQGYGRFAYQDASASEDSDREFGSSGQSSRREMVSLSLLQHLITCFRFQLS